jgi:hypothetical protein
VWPCVAIAALALPVMFAGPKRHAIVAGAAGLAALAQMLSPTIAYVWSLR